MPFRHHDLRALIVVDPEAAKRLLKQAFVDAGASRKAAASLLGCSRATYLAWAKQLELREWMQAVSKLARQNGWHHGQLGGAACHRSRN